MRNKKNMRHMTILENNFIITDSNDGEVRIQKNDYKNNQEN